MLDGLDLDGRGDLGFRVFWQDHRFYRKSLLAVSMVCKTLYIRVQSVLLRNVELELGLERSTPSINNLIPRLMKSRVLASHIRALSFMFDWSYLYERSRLLDTTQPPSCDEAGWPVSEMVNKDDSDLFSIARPDFCLLELAHLIPFLGLLPSLQALKFAGPWKPQFIGALKLENFGSLSENFRSLTEISLHWGGNPHLYVRLQDKHDFNVLELLPLFLLPNIRTLLFDFPDARSNHVVPAMSQYNGKSSVKELIISYWTIGESALSALLRLPANLGKFTLISKETRYSMDEILSFEGLSKSLLIQAHSLKSITIDGPPDTEIVEIPYSNKIWKDFKVLEEFSTPMRPLLGENDITRCLDDQLPPSLISLTLYAHDQFTLQMWANQLTKLISAKNVCYPKLENIQLKVWIRAIWRRRRDPALGNPELRAASLREYTSEIERIGWLQLAKENDIKVEIFFNKEADQNWSW
jgi:hypothetical protein